MTNTDKLLHALIDAMGFEVEEVVSFPGYEEDLAKYKAIESPAARAITLLPVKFDYQVIDYKLTKKEATKSIWKDRPIEEQNRIMNELNRDLSSRKIAINEYSEAIIETFRK